MKKGIHFIKTNSGIGGVYMFYQCGGAFEKKGFRGLTHLAEHLACKGENPLKQKIVTSNLETNAYTDDGVVCFYFSGLEDLAAKFVPDYLNARSYIPTEEEFYTEKEIVIQEVMSSLSDNTIDHALIRGMFNYYGACGDIDDIKNMPYDKFIKFYKDIYGKPSVVVFSGGKNMERAYKKSTSAISIKEDDRQKIKVKMNSVLNRDSFDVWSSKDSKNYIFFKQVNKSVKRSQLNFLMMLLGDGFYSPFYQKIREEKKLCYYIRPDVSEIGGKNIFSVQTETEKIADFSASLFDILKNFEAYVTPEYFANYVQKLMNSMRKIDVLGGHSRASMFYSDDDSLYNTFTPDNPLFSYDEMKRISKIVAKDEGWQGISHIGKEIKLFI